MNEEKRCGLHHWASAGPETGSWSLWSLWSSISTMLCCVMCMLYDNYVGKKAVVMILGVLKKDVGEKNKNLVCFSLIYDPTGNHSQSKSSQLTQLCMLGCLYDLGKYLSYESMSVFFCVLLGVTHPFPQ